MKNLVNVQLKKHLILTLLTIISSQAVLFSQIDCQWNPYSLEPMIENLTVTDCPAVISFDDYDLISPFTIYINIHFYEDDNGNIFDTQTGIGFANDLIDRANNFYLNNMEQNSKPGPNGMLSAHIPKAKYQYKIYTEPSNVNDIHGGIWFHPTQNADANIYNNRVIDIHFTGNPQCNSGYSWTGGDVRIFGVLECGLDNVYLYAKLLNHEMGHSLDLDHVTWCNNQCRDVDIDTEEECEPNCPELATCDGINPSEIECSPGNVVSRCGWNVGNNIVSQGQNQKALTPCQWETVFNRVLSVNTRKYSWADNCTEVAEDFIVESGEHIIWDNLKLLNRNVVIKPKATLTITCEVRMAAGLDFIVERGAKLIVDGGKITRICPDTYWGRIQVWGNTYKEQPDPFGILEVDDAGVVILKNAEIEYGRHAITTNRKHPVSGGNYDSHWGGLISADNTIFRNNHRAVEFMKYKFKNKSKFIDCKFIEEADGRWNGRCHHLGMPWYPFRAKYF